VKAIVQLFRGCVTLAMLGVPRMSAAALGGDVSSIQADQAQLKATRTVAMDDGYAVHELLTPAGVVVREYLSPAGIVFAVAWHGPFLPDMRQIFGTYFERYARKERGGHHRHLAIDEPDFVVYAGGHMRAFWGSAYLPLLVPPGIDPEGLR
jgi:hypothetical protein